MIFEVSYTRQSGRSVTKMVEHNTILDATRQVLEKEPEAVRDLSVQPAAADTLPDSWYIARARDTHEREGELEIDDEPVVSRGEDAGAYVQAWIWVADPERGEA